MGNKHFTILLESQGITCAICHTDMVLGGKRGKKGLGATIDHIIPKSHGGRDALFNKQLVHSKCNFEKQSSLPPEDSLKHPYLIRQLKRIKEQPNE